MAASSASHGRLFLLSGEVSTSGVTLVTGGYVRLPKRLPHSLFRFLSDKLQFRFFRRRSIRKAFYLALPLGANFSPTDMQLVTLLPHRPEFMRFSS